MFRTNFRASYNKSTLYVDSLFLYSRRFNVIFTCYEKPLSNEVLKPSVLLLCVFGQSGVSFIDVMFLQIEVVKSDETQRTFW